MPVDWRFWKCKKSNRFLRNLVWRLPGRQWRHTGTNKKIWANYQTQSARLEKWAPKDFNFNEFVKGLACIQATPLCPGCKKNGGNPACEVRICASKRKITNCRQCDGLAECKNFESLEQSYPKIKEELRKIKNVDQKEVIKSVNELKTKWPHCVLLCERAKK